LRNWLFAVDYTIANQLKNIDNGKLDIDIR